MGYTWEAWAVDPEALVRELRTPTLPAMRVRVDPLDDVMVRAVQQWDTLAAAVADTVRDGTGHLTGERVSYVVALVRALGRFAGSVGHTSSGGPWFRSDVINRQVGAVIGRHSAAHLLERELAGLTMSGEVTLGWLSAAECTQLTSHATTPADTLAFDDEEAHDVLAAISTAASLATGLVTVYL